MNAITTTERILSEDLLKHVYSCQQNSHRPTIASIAGALQISPNEATLLVTI